MRTIKLILSLLVAAACAAPALFAAQGTSVRAILIMASNEKGPADPKLSRYEAELQRNVPESSFRYVNEGTASVSGVGSKATLTLGGAHRLALEGESGSGPGVRVKIQWLNGRDTVMSGSFVLEPGVPVMLGRRPSGNGEVPIVLVIAR